MINFKLHDTTSRGGRRSPWLLFFIAVVLLAAALLPAAVPLPAHPMAHPEVCLLLPLLAAPTAHLVVQFPPAPAAASIRQVATTRADSVDNRSSPPILSFLFLGLIIL